MLNHCGYDSKLSLVMCGYIQVMGEIVVCIFWQGDGVPLAGGWSPLSRPFFIRISVWVVNYLVFTYCKPLVYQLSTLFMHVPII